MPEAHGYRYIIAARDDLTYVAEGRALRRADSKSTAKFFWEEIICRYGHIAEVVTDNGSEVKGAFERLLHRYGIPQIKISPYNKHANRLVEQGHFTIRESILKDYAENIQVWLKQVHLVFFADRVTTRRVTGFSPYYLLHGTHPVLPFDLIGSSAHSAMENESDEPTAQSPTLAWCHHDGGESGDLRAGVTFGEM